MRALVLNRPGPFGTGELKIKPDLRRDRPRRHIVRAAERREEIVERGFVGQVDDGKLRADLVLIAVKEIIVAHGSVENTPRLDSLWIVIVVLRIGRRYFYQRGPETRGQAGARQSLGRGCMLQAAEESGLELLVGGQWRTADGVNQVDRWLAV